MTDHDQWDVRAAAATYGVDRWGESTFSISESGEVLVHLGAGDDAHPVSLFDLARGLDDRGIGLPIMLRFSRILHARIALINDAFNKTIKDLGYHGEYRGVYPIKVNQQQQVVEEVARFGARYHHGLEAGSKAELLAALTYMRDPEAYIICNGYKDAEFIDLALYACKMGLRTVIVVEMLAEVRLLAARVEALGIRPRIGLRMKLSTPGSGQWLESGGDQSVFGLTTAQLMAAVDDLRALGLLDCVQLLHYHLGSQIPNINTIRQGATEAARVYEGLVHEGAPMGQLDVGGGLAVDYDGSQTNVAGSCNYTVEEYCADIIEVVMTVLDAAGVDHPTIVSESGRATVAPYGVLLFNVLDVAERITRGAPEPLAATAHQYTKSLHQMIEATGADNLQESFNDATFYLDQVRQLFEFGNIGLRERSSAERCFNDLMMRILAIARAQNEAPEELTELHRTLADVYYGNFSLFQSLPDSWAIDQLFPVMPIHRLDERPDRQGVLADITCDCDGKIDRFIGDQEQARALPLHSLRPGEPYIIGVFLVGAYQETLGDLHNLFGDTHVVSIDVDEDGQPEYSGLIKGDTAEEVLSYVEYEPREMTRRFQQAAERAVNKGLLTPRERRQVVEAFESGMRGYTYFRG